MGQFHTLHLQICPLNGNFTDSCSDSSYFIPTLRAHHLADQVLTDLPPSNGDFTDSCSDSSLLWELIIWQTRLADLTPPTKWQFHRFLWNSYFIPTLRAQHLADQVLADLPLIKGNFTDFCSTLRAHIWQTKCWQIYPLSNGNFTDSCSDSSYFILLWELNIWQTRSWQIYPHINGNFTDSSLTVTAHISFLLWELNIWQTRSWQIYPHQMAPLQIPALLWELIFSRPPCWIVISQIPGLSGHYSESSTFGITGLGRSTPFIRWQFHRFHRFHSYSKSSTFGWPSVGRSTPITYWFHRWQFHRFLPLQIILIFHPPPLKLWFQSWLFGRPCCTCRSPTLCPPIKLW